MKRLFLFLIALSITTFIYCQAIDTTLYVQCQIIKIERSMLVGNWLTIESNTGEIRYAVEHYIDKKTRDLLNQCILIPRDHWNDLHKTKRR